MIKKIFILAIGMLLVGCAPKTVIEAVKQHKIETWAYKSDGSQEKFTASYKDVVYVNDDPPVFYVTSPSGIKVYFQQGFRYFELDKNGDRIEIRLDGKVVKR